MKKTLVALAALAVVSAASAQSSVTIYGLMDLGLTNAKDSGNLGGVSTDASLTSIKSGNYNGSRIGFKGTEDLGGGLKANFVMEYGVQPDEATTTTTMNNRQSFVGLSGDFGAVTIGRQYTPYYNVVGALDQAGFNTLPGQIVNNHLIGGNARENAIQYASPTFSGFSATVQVANGTEVARTDNLATNAAEGRSYGFAGVYAAGPLVAGLLYDEVTSPAGALVNYKTNTGVANAALGTATYALFGVGSKATKVWAAGALYDFGVAKASLAYSSLKDVKLVGADITSKGINLSVGVPIGATTLVGNLGRANVVQTGTIDAVITGLQLEANYSLSKRTTAYAAYGSDKLTIDTVSGDATRTSMAVGIRHTF